VGLTVSLQVVPHSLCYGIRISITPLECHLFPWRKPFFNEFSGPAWICLGFVPRIST
jgi:hypothetical protein